MGHRNGLQMTALPTYIALFSGAVFEANSPQTFAQLEAKILIARSALNKIGPTGRRSHKDTVAVWSAMEGISPVEIPTEEIDGELFPLWPAEEFTYLYVTQKGAVEPSQHDGQGTVNKIGPQIPTKEFWANGQPRRVTIGETEGSSAPKIALRIRGGKKSIRLSH